MKTSDSQPSMTDATAVNRILCDVTGDRLMGTALDLTMHPATNSQHSQFNPNTASAHFCSDVFNEPSPTSPPEIREDLELSAAQIERGCDLFFASVSHYVPFVHRPTFRVSQATWHLLFSILCLVYQHGEDPDCDEEAGSRTSLSLRCFH